MRPTLRRLLAVLAVALGGLLWAAAPASAHAYLERADPAPDSTLDRSPSRLTLDFTEPVRVESGSVQVLDPGGRRVDAGDARRGGGGDQVVVDLRPDLPRGTYVVTWRVVSADSHPVSGAYALGVGTAPDTSAAAASGRTGAGSPAVGYLAGVARAVGTGGLVLLVGGGFFLLAVWPAGLGRRLPRQLLWTGWGVTLGAAVASLLLQGPYSTGRDLSALGSWDLVSSTAHSRYGHLVLLRILLLLLAVPPLRGLAAGTRGGRPELAALAVAVVLTEAAVGHAGVGDAAWLAVASQALHVTAASVWIGGLAVLAVFLLRPRAADTLAPVLPRWSRTATAAVAVLALSGAYQAWREVGTPPALPGTAYGRLLLAKLALFAVLLALGWLGRRWIVRRFRPVVHAAVDAQVAAATAAPPPGPAEVRTLRRRVGAEILLGAAVLLVTSVLVAAAPARSSYGPPFDTTVTVGPLTVRVEVPTTRRGPQTVDVSASDGGGRAAQVAEVSGELSLPARRVGPIRVPFTSTGPGRATSGAVTASLPGTWQLRLAVRVDDFTEYAATIPYRVH